METPKNKELAEVFKIFANKHRLAILGFLKSKGERPVGDIADNIGASFKATSKHLLFLTKTGILTRRYDGLFVLYSISDNIPESARIIIHQLIKHPNRDR